MATYAELVRARADDPRRALLFEGRSWTWAEVVDESCQRAGLIAEICAPGAHIGILLDNVPDYLFWINGAALAGVTVVGINPTRRGVHLARDVAHTDVTVIVSDQGHLPLLEQSGIELPVVLIEHAEHAGLTAPDHVDDAGTRLLLLFTSGSTGAPKAVVCTNGRLGRIAGSAAELFGITTDDVTYQSMPMFHGNALMSNLAPATAAAAGIVLRRRFSASGFLSDVRTHHATYFNYVGRSLAYVLATPPTADDRGNRLRLGFGTEASARDIEEFTTRFGCTIVESYGSSEGVIAISKLPGCPPDALGAPAPGQEVVILGADGQVCPPARRDSTGRLVNAAEAIGEIVSLRGAESFEGYYRNPEAEVSRLDGSMYRTGDLGFRDEDGWFYFAGRDTDWLRVDSENFAAAPVEAVLGRFEPVVVAAVYAVPDPRTGDSVMVALQLREPFDAAAFGQFLRASPDLGTKWAPRYVRVLDTVPVTGTNKVAKQSLRADRWDAPDVWIRVGDNDYRPMTDADRHRLSAEFAGHGRSHLLV